MAENFLDTRKINIQVHESQRVPNKMNPKRNRHIIIKVVKVKNKEIILKAAKAKQLIVHKGNHRRLLAVFFISQKGVAWHIQSSEREKNSLPCKVVIQNWEIKSFPDKK